VTVHQGDHGAANSLEQMQSFCFVSRKFHICDWSQRHFFLTLVEKNWQIAFE
jgi:hypothetical protein